MVCVGAAARIPDGPMEVVKRNYTALSAKNLHFRHSSEEWPQVNGVSFALRAGRTLGILGRNECGKTTLAQLLLGSLRQDTGEVLVQGKELVTSGSCPPPALSLVRVLLMLSLAAAGTFAWLQRAWFVAACRSGAYAVPLLLLFIEGGRMIRARLDEMKRTEESGWAPTQARAVGMAYISSEHDAAQRLDPNLTIEEAIGREMPLEDKAGRRREVLAALAASGFQMYTDTGKPTGNPETYLADGVTLGQCSGGACFAPAHAACTRQIRIRTASARGQPPERGKPLCSSSAMQPRHPPAVRASSHRHHPSTYLGQRHLIYILSVLASRPSVLIADEMLCGLDIDRQASVLTMLQRLQARTGLAILYMSVDLAPVSIMVRATRSLVETMRAKSVARGARLYFFGERAGCAGINCAHCRCRAVSRRRLHARGLVCRGGRGARAAGDATGGADEGIRARLHAARAAITREELAECSPHRQEHLRPLVTTTDGCTITCALGSRVIPPPHLHRHPPPQEKRAVYDL